MENKNFYDVIVIGGGPGGYGAALYTSRANLTTLVVEKFAPGGQMGTTEIVENYPGFTEGINGFELGMQMKQGAERFGVESIQDIYGFPERGRKSGIYLEFRSGGSACR